MDSKNTAFDYIRQNIFLIRTSLMANPSLISVTHAEFQTFFSMIEELADFEELARPNNEAKARLYKDTCGEFPRIQAYLIRFDEKDCGYAITFHSYSSFLAKPTLYLEDIYIQPHHRKQGIGTSIMKQLATKALSDGCGRMEWVVLDWNTSAQEFYHGIGAVHMKEWYPFRLTEEAMQHFIDS